MVWLPFLQEGNDMDMRCVKMKSSDVLPLRGAIFLFFGKRVQPRKREKFFCMRQHFVVFSCISGRTARMQFKNNSGNRKGRP